MMNHRFLFLATVASVAILAGVAIAKHHTLDSFYENVEALSDNEGGGGIMLIDCRVYHIFGNQYLLENICAIGTTETYVLPCSMGGIGGSEKRKCYYNGGD